MQRHESLPTELGFLTSKVNFIQRVNPHEWSGSCPKCGGEPHRGGELPDRFRMFTNARGKNKILGWCRRCGHLEFPDSKPLSRDEMEYWRQEQIKREEERRRSAERALAHLRSEKLWLFYNNALNDYAVDVLKSWGIRRDWADYWRLGLFADYTVKSGKEEYHSPAITIPMWQQDAKTPANIKLRVLNNKYPHDRYRNLYKMGKSASFTAFPGMKSDILVLVEGEKKAMNVAQWSESKYQVVGLPTVTPEASLLASSGQYGKVYVCLDPDAKEGGDNSPLRRLVRLLGREVHVVDLPDKVDDMIIKGMKFDAAMKYATPLEVK